MPYLSIRLTHHACIMASSRARRHARHPSHPTHQTIQGKSTVTEQNVEGRWAAEKGAGWEKGAEGDPLASPHPSERCWRLEASKRHTLVCIPLLPSHVNQPVSLTRHSHRVFHKIHSPPSDSHGNAAGSGLPGDRDAPLRIAAQRRSLPISNNMLTIRTFLFSPRSLVPPPACMASFLASASHKSSH